MKSIYLLVTEDKILITIAVILPKEIKGSCQIPSHFWAGSYDFLASNSDFTLFEAVNMWWDFLEISWTLEISVLLLKYLFCNKFCVHNREVFLSAQTDDLQILLFFPHFPLHAKLSKVEVALWDQELRFFTFTFFSHIF